MEFRVLGPLEVRSGGLVLALGGLRQRRVLAALLLHPNRVVSLSQLAAAAWDDDPPATLDRQVRNRVGALRRVLTPGGALIDTEGGGYRLRVGPGELDSMAFADLAQRGRAAGLLRQALALWRGPALADLGGTLLAQETAPLVDQRLAVWEECLELEVAEGGHARVVAELAGLVAEHPLRERLVGLLMTALYRCGRRDEALATYRGLAARLADELGIDPSPQLRRLHDAVGRYDPDLRAGARSAIGSVSGVPAQLPADVWAFAGRVTELDRLDQVLSDGQTGPAVVISAIAGTAGVGKTALAVHWAHRVRDKFPDGQLYANLRGFDPDGSVVTPAQALRRFLNALQVAPERIPASLDGQVELYRSLLAGRRMLIVLDNARDADHVRALLPGVSSCLVLVTSRNRPADLVADRILHPITLGLLSAGEARQMMGRRLGEDRVAAEPEAVDEIIALCARLPLALAIVAARAVLNERAPLGVLAGELRRTRGGLGPFTGEDPRTDVRSVFSWSYRTLTVDAARLFRLLGLHPGPDLAVPAAASLAGVPAVRVEASLAELTRAHLLTEHVPGRYAFHDLLRAYATEQAHAIDSDTDRRAALRRMLDHYLHTAYAAAVRLDPGRQPPTLTPPQPGITRVDFEGTDQIMAWFSAEHPVLLSVVDQAATTGFDSHASLLPWTFMMFLYRRGLWHDWIDTHQRALEAAARLGDRPIEAWVSRSLAAGYAQLGRFDDAHSHGRHAIELTGELGDLFGQVLAHENLSHILNQQGRYPEALEHARQALDLARADNDPTAQARALNGVGWAHALLGEHEQALTYCQQALTIYRQIDQPFNEASVWDSLGYAHHHLGRYEQALVCYKNALRLIRDTGGAHKHEAMYLCHLGEMHQATGDLDLARAAWQQALATFDQADHPIADTVRDHLRRLDTTYR
jgi:DNA-binding SARP family transcriptional activator/Tfp pilus assembly protein PilF